MAITKVQITHDKAGNLFWPGTPTKNQFINAFINFLSGLMSGVYSGGASGVIVRRTNAVKAVGTLTISGGSGNLVPTIGGTAVTTAFNTDDATTGGDMATDINADATASLYVTATDNGDGTVTLTANEAGAVGNAIALTVSGTGLTADGSGFMGGTTAGSEDTAVSLNL